MKQFIQIISPFRNKFLLAGTGFIVWMLFFDRNDVFEQMDKGRELRELQESKTYYQQEIAAESKFAEELKNNPAIIEKFARERYFMKKDNEDLFIIQEEVN